MSNGVILGAISAAQLKQNCEDSAKGPPPQEEVDTLDEACQIVSAHESAPFFVLALGTLEIREMCVLNSVERMY